MSEQARLRIALLLPISGSIIAVAIAVALAMWLDIASVGE